CTRDSYAMDYW
nr:immunoglobulin heavy chain junction region [Mus musculus]MBK4190045.1 immunoglobulin heavy chain junction region [Mus musculus]MBK4190046.1 immunoglobulin heavy chain junction region [Mus musculus]